MRNIVGLDAGELCEAFSPWRVPAYRARQVAEWMYQKGVGNFQAMTNLPKALRETLAAHFCIAGARARDRQDAHDGRTTKFLLEFADGVAIEAVLMRQPYGNSICLSTQAGCAMGCAFCASTVHGLERDLTAGEILSQALFIDGLLRQNGETVGNIVLMGSGEPLANYAEVVRFLRLVHEKYTMNMGYRRIALSTAGIVPSIYRLAEEGMPITLSISLHAPNEDLRSRLMPINRRYPLAEVVQAGKAYAERTKRRVTYEYILIGGVNDGRAEAEELCRLLRGQLANVNLIPANPVAGREWHRPTPGRIQAFADCLAARGLPATIRREMGTGIQAACGQLRNRYIGKTGKE